MTFLGRICFFFLLLTHRLQSIAIVYHNVLLLSNVSRIQVVTQDVFDSRPFLWLLIRLGELLSLSSDQG